MIKRISKVFVTAILCISMVLLIGCGKDDDSSDLEYRHRESEKYGIYQESKNNYIIYGSDDEVYRAFFEYGNMHLMKGHIVDDVYVKDGEKTLHNRDAISYKSIVAVNYEPINTTTYRIVVEGSTFTMKYSSDMEEIYVKIAEVDPDYLFRALE